MMEYSEEEQRQTTALRLSTLTAQLESCLTQLQQQSSESLRSMKDSAQTLTRQSQQLSSELMQTVSQQTHGAMVHGLQQGLAPLNQASRDAGTVTAALSQELSSLRAAQRTLVWKAGLALLIGSVLAVAASGWLLWKTQRELQQAKFPSQVLEATRSGAITVCGDALCVKAGKNPQRYGHNDDYLLVQTATPAAQ